MNIEALNELRSFYAQQTQHMTWSVPFCIGGVLARSYGIDEREASTVLIASALGVSPRIARCLFHLTPDNSGVTVPFHPLTLDSQKAMLAFMLDHLEATNGTEVRTTL